MENVLKKINELMEKLQQEELDRVKILITLFTIKVELEDINNRLFMKKAKA